MLSQEKEESIYKNEKGNWELDQTTVEANYYAMQERDSLINEVSRLRKRITSLEEANINLTNKVIDFTKKLEEQLKINETATTDLNEVNDEIISVWSKIYKGIKLDATALTDFKEQIYAGLILKVPLDLNWDIKANALYDIKSTTGNIQYFVGVNYNIF